MPVDLRWIHRTPDLCIFFRPSGARLVFIYVPHGLRRGLHSFAAPRLCQPVAFIERRPGGKQKSRDL